jgi:hypothetical protein
MCQKTPLSNLYLSDFNLITDELSIVTVSFVTLKSYIKIKYCNANIHILDIMEWS